MKDKKTKSKRMKRNYPRKKTNKKSISKNKKLKRYQKNKRSIKKQKGGNEGKTKDLKIIKPLKNDPIVLRYMILNYDVIEFLPSSRIFKENNMGHYLSMIKLEDLLTLVNKFPDYKKSPKIQQIFNYNSSYLVDKNKITFKYTDIKCENLLLKEKEEYNLKKLFLYILNCNAGNRMKEIILKGGYGDDDYDDDDDDKDYSFNEKVNEEIDRYRSMYPYNDEEKWSDERLRSFVTNQIRKKEYEERDYKLKNKELEIRENEYKKKKEEEEKEKIINDEPKPDEPKLDEPTYNVPKSDLVKPDENKSDKLVDKLIPDEFISDEPKPKENIISDKPEKEEILTSESDVEAIEEDLDETEEKIDDIESDIDSLEDNIEIIKEKQKEKEKNTIEKIEELIEKKKKEKSEREENERIERENFEKMRFDKMKNIEIKEKGLEQYLEDNKIVNISKNEFAIHNTNWFNVCCGIESYDELFELEVIDRINSKGIIIDTEDTIQKIKNLFEDEDEKELFYKMIKSRLLECSEIEEPNIFERIFSDKVGMFKECDKRENDSVLYMYDGYRAFLKRKLKIKINKLERALILIFCETRQELLSKYIGLEVLRRKQFEDDNKSNVITLLDNIMEIDKEKIKENDKKLEEIEDKKHDDYRLKEIDKVRKTNTMEILSKEKELKEKRREKELLMGEKGELEDKLEIFKPIDESIRNMNYEERNKKFEEELNKTYNSNWRKFEYGNKGVIDNIMNGFNNLTKKSENSVNLQLTPDEEEALKNMEGGGESEKTENYQLSKEYKNQLCKELEKTKQFKMRHLDIINDC